MDALIMILALICFFVLAGWITLKITYFRTLRKNNFFKIKRAAKKGDLDAQLKIADFYIKGIDGEYINKEEGVKWLHMAAEQGDLKTQMDLAYRYSHGYDVTKNAEEALKWYQRAAQNADVDTLKRIAVNCRYELNNDEEALKWYLKAAEQGDVEAQVEVGNLYRRNKRVQQNYEEALKWYQRAAQNADVKTLKRIAVECRYKLENDEEAFKMYLKAAEHGDYEAQIEVGEMYLEGKGVQQNSEKALEWYLDAVDKGNTEAQIRIAEMYLHGVGVPKNVEEGIKWIQRAADEGNPSAMEKLANWYIKGEYVDKNIHKGFGIILQLLDDHDYDLDTSEIQDYLLKEALRGDSDAETCFIHLCRDLDDYESMQDAADAGLRRAIEALEEYWDSFYGKDDEY